MHSVFTLLHLYISHVTSHHAIQQHDFYKTRQQSECLTIQDDMHSNAVQFRMFRFTFLFPPSTKSEEDHGKCMHNKTLDWKICLKELSCTNK